MAARCGRRSCGSVGRMSDGARIFARPRSAAHSPGCSAATRRAAIISRHDAAIRPNSAAASRTAAGSQLLDSASAPTLCSRTTSTTTTMLCAAHASSAAMQPRLLSPATGARMAADAEAQTPALRSVDVSRHAAARRVASTPQRYAERAPHRGSNLGPAAPRCTPWLPARAFTAPSSPSSSPGALAYSRTHALTWRRRRGSASPHCGTLPVGLPGRPDAGRRHRRRRRQRPRSPGEPSCRRAATAVSAAAHGLRGPATRRYAVARRCADEVCPQAAIGRSALESTPERRPPTADPGRQRQAADCCPAGCSGPRRTLCASDRGLRAPHTGTTATHAVTSAGANGGIAAPTGAAAADDDESATADADEAAARARDGQPQ